MSEITKEVNTVSIICGNNDALVVDENTMRRQLYATATGGDVWIKFTETADDQRTGLLIKQSSPFPFGLMPNDIYYGKVYAVNAVADETPTIHIVELVRET